MAFHKRRRLPAKNKNDAKSLRRSEGSVRPRLENLYPALEKLSIKLRFNDPNGHFLDETFLTFSSQDQVNFQVLCPGRCGDGQMNLEGKLNDIIQNHETTSESRGKCDRVLYAGSSETCGYELQCHVEASYRS